MNEPVSKCLLVLAALQVRALQLLACVVLIPYKRTCIEVFAALQALLAGAWLLVGACLCGTDTL